MTVSRFGNLRQQLQRILRLGDARLSDGELLERFVKYRDEKAFAALVGRYGRLVLGVCERLLPDANDAEDAFQATFLVLVRNAANLDGARSLSHWLYTIAYRTAMKAKIGIARRHHRERLGIDGLAVELQRDSVWQEVHPVLDEELTKLPQSDRAVLVLYYLDGKTQQQIADELRLPPGSMSRRLARARRLLRMRLVRRGVGATSAVMFAAMARYATARSVPGPLAVSTIKGALRFRAGEVATGLVSAKAASLAEAVLRLLAVGKMVGTGKTLSSLLLAGILTTGWWITSDSGLPSIQANLASALDVPRRPVPHARDLRWRLQTTVPAEGALATALAPDERLLALGSRMPDTSIRIWDLAINQERCRLLGHRGSIHALTFSANGKLLATGSQDRTVRLWDVDHQREINTLKGHELGIKCVDLSLTGNQLASGGLDRSIRIWDISGAQQWIIVNAHHGPVDCIAFSPDGKLLVSGGGEGQIVYWEPSTRKELARMEGHAGGVSSLCFAANGARLASSGRDGKILIWDTTSHRRLATFVADAQWMKRAYFSLDGNVLAAETGDQRRPLWPLDSDLAGSAAPESGSDAIQLRLAAIEDHQVRIWHLLRCYPGNSSAARAKY
jgi:RNA polymerase sigma factor (sigma-70 family)